MARGDVRRDVRRRPTTLTAFGPGKVILLGEHGVVYGHPALAAPLSFGVTATATPSKRCELVMPAGASAAARKLLQAAFDKVAREVGSPEVKVELSSQIPLSMGLGSSGALAVATARLLLQAAGREASVEEVQRLAFLMEKEFHGTPSGVDHTTSARGELLYYRRAPGEAVGHAEAVKAKKPLELVIAIAGERTGTKATVAALRTRKEQWPARYDRIFSSIAALVEDARFAIEEGDAPSLGDLMNMNHGLLSALGLSSQRIDSVVHGMRELGAQGAKLTGAGGDGGAVIGLFADPERVLPKLRRAGLQCFKSRIDVTT
ncbi:MAG: mevalonate kinase [Myxococcaceae bacterium]